MASERKYHVEQDLKNTVRLRDLVAALPPYTKEFFRGIEPHTSSRTRIAYAYDLRVFFQFLHETNPALKNKDVREITLRELEQLRPADIEEYLDYVKVYVGNDLEIHSNQLQAIKRKLASLRSFYKYFYMRERITYNPVELVAMPKLHEKNIVRLDADEVAELLDHVEAGSGLTKKQQAFHEKSKIRDMAMMSLFLGTGIRVSECVGLNLSDVDFKNSGISIHRKGGKEVTVYFGEEVEEALGAYLEERRQMTPCEGHEEALFLSSQMKRMSVRTVENMVKKYTQTVTTSKNITPHKLRSTYGTALYQETGDIYLVADVLGHSDVNTTRKHYAALEDEQRRRARNAVHLRKD
ncbi:MAG: tyrosine-type recombinase/integrase [Lachnospiraceae bacterium]|nr:tyrosine-type recombinase/integrase [Lachnospiraceae bacterium]